MRLEIVSDESYSKQDETQNGANTMKTKPTEAPWKIGKAKTSECGNIAATISKDRYIATVPINDDQQIADARLIVAAPLMLEALQCMLDAFVHVDGDPRGNKARTDIFKYGQDAGGMADAATKARQLVCKLTRTL